MRRTQAIIYDPLTPSLEDYLEAVLDLGTPARVSAVADRLNVAKASVTEAARKLKEMGYVYYARYGPLDLTPKGLEVAREVRNRHDALILFLVNILGVPAAVAARDACVLEHGLSAETAARLATFVAAKVPS